MTHTSTQRSVTPVPSGVGSATSACGYVPDARLVVVQPADPESLYLSGVASLQRKPANNACAAPCWCAMPMVEISWPGCCLPHSLGCLLPACHDRHQIVFLLHTIQHTHASQMHMISQMKCVSSKIYFNRFPKGGTSRRPLVFRTMFLIISGFSNNYV